MPNWVITHVERDGIGELPIYTEEDKYGNKDIDFNKLIPMPDSLNITAGGNQAETVIFYISNRLLDDTLSNLSEELICNLCGYYYLHPSIEELIARTKEYIKDKTSEELDALYNLGKQYVDNYNSYGAINWYIWRIKNWGTKWNASETQIFENDCLIMNTAWSCPVPILEEISKQYPDQPLEYWYADEACGYNTGYGYYDGQTFSHTYFKDYSSEAFETVIKCWGEGVDIYKDEDGKYRMHDENGSVILGEPKYDNEGHEILLSFKED